MSPRLRIMAAPLGDDMTPQELLAAARIIPVRYYVVERRGEYLTREEAEGAWSVGATVILGQNLTPNSLNGRPRRASDSHGKYPVQVPVRPQEGARVQEVSVYKVAASLGILDMAVLSRCSRSAHSTQQWGYWPVVRRAAVKASYILAGVTFGFYLAMVFISR